MAIQAVGMGFDASPDYRAWYRGNTDTCFKQNVRLEKGSDHVNLYLQIHIDEDLSQVSRVRVSAAWKTVGRNVAGTYGPFNDGLWGHWEPSGSTDNILNPHTNTELYSGTDLSIELHQIGWILPGGTTETPSGTSLGGEIAPKSYKYEDRTYDSICIDYVVAVEYKDGTPESRVVCPDMYVAYIPEFTLKGAHIEDDAVVVEYDPGDWQRPDDRWYVLSFAQDGKELVDSGNTTAGTLFNVIDRPGRISITLYAFKSIPRAKSTDIDIRMNANYRAEGDEWGVHVKGTVWFFNYMDCDTPTLSLRYSNEDAIIVHVGDSYDKDNVIVKAYVTLVDYSGPGTTAEVEMDGSSGGAVTFMYPPLNRDFTVEAIGYNDLGGTSEVASITVPAITSGGGSVAPGIAAEDGSASVRLRFNVKMDWTYEPDMETVKLAGRSRETVGYGVGGSVTGSLSCDILDDDAYGDYHQRRQDFEALAFAGTCVYRDESGSRRRVAIDSVGESWDTVRFVKTMKLSVREVS